MPPRTRRSQLTRGYSTPMRFALLRGREHTKLGAVAALAEGSCAVALSRGGFAKGYQHRDANEDAVAFGLGPGGALLAVADGHGGHEAAELAVSLLLEGFGEAWTGAGSLAPRWERAAGDALARIHAEIVGRGATGGNADARTTLALAVVRPGEDLLAFAAVGDSHVFVADDECAIDVAAPEGSPAYLGTPSLEPGELAARSVVGARPLAEARALALATDGLSEHGIGVPAPDLAVMEALGRAARSRRELWPLEAARSLVECALASHRRNRPGDNGAAAALSQAGRAPAARARGVRGRGAPPAAPARRPRARAPRRPTRRRRRGRRGSARGQPPPRCPRRGRGARARRRRSRRG